MIYLFLFALLIVFSFLEINVHKPIEYRLAYYTTVTAMVLVAGLRYNTGFDIREYGLMFKFADASNYKEFLLEPGSFLIIFVLQTLHLGFQVYLFVYALVCVTLKSAFFTRYSPYIFLALLIYFPVGFLINEMGQIRHGLAIAIVLIAFHHLFHNRNKWFLFLVVLAVFFHVSAFIVLPVLLFVNRQPNTSILLLAVFVLSGLLFFDSRPLFLSFLEHIPIPSIRGKATLYLYSEQYGKPLGFNISYLLRVLIFYFLIYFRKIGTSRFPFYNKLILLYFYGIILYIVFNSVSEFAIRTSTYFKALDCIILPCLVTFGKDKREKILIWGIVVLYASYSLYKLLSDPLSAPYFIPYHSVFST